MRRCTLRHAKNGKPAAHPLRCDEVRALRELRQQFPDSAFVFATERGHSVEKVKAWQNSKAYEAIKPIRHKSATTRNFIVEGAAPQ